MGNLKLKMTIAQEKKYIGDEPEVGSKVDKILDALNHFNYFYNKLDAINFLTSYLKKNDVQFLKTHDLSKISPTLGWIARMKEREVVLPLNATKWFDENLKKLPLKSVTAVEETVVSICEKVEETVEEKLSNVLKHDVLLNLEFLKKSQINDYDKQNVINILQKRHQFLNGDIENLLKSFSKEYLVAMRKNIAAALKIYSVIPEKEVAVKMPKKKVSTAKNNTKGIELISEDTLTGLKSLSKEMIFGKTLVAFYQPHVTAIRVFFAEEGKTFEVDGTHILNIDMTRSFQKRVKNPEQNMKRMLKVTKAKFLNVAHEVGKSEYPLTHGRVASKHMLIVAY